jgi:hypothetical protein
MKGRVWVVFYFYVWGKLILTLVFMKHNQRRKKTVKANKTNPCSGSQPSIKFSSIQSVLYPEALRELIVNDSVCQQIDKEGRELSERAIQRVEQLRIENGLEYNTPTAPIWVKDSKFSEAYIKSK